MWDMKKLKSKYQTTPVNFLKDMGNFYLSYLIRKTGYSSLAVVRNDVLILLIHLGI